LISDDSQLKTLPANAKPHHSGESKNDDSLITGSKLSLILNDGNNHPANHHGDDSEEHYGDGKYDEYDDDDFEDLPSNFGPSIPTVKKTSAHKSEQATQKVVPQNVNVEKPTWNQAENKKEESHEIKQLAEIASQLSLLMETDKKSTTANQEKPISPEQKKHSKAAKIAEIATSMTQLADSLISTDESDPNSSEIASSASKVIEIASKLSKIAKSKVAQIIKTTKGDTSPRNGKLYDVASQLNLLASALGDENGQSGSSGDNSAPTNTRMLGKRNH